MSVTISLDGDGIQFEREISEDTALSVMQITIGDGDTDSVATEPEVIEDTSDSTEDGTEEDISELPGSFFDRITGKQEAFIRVLLEDGDWVSNSEVRKRMEEEHDETTQGGRAIAGIQSGLTRKYGDDFDLIDRRYRNDQYHYRLNPEQNGYISELEEYYSK